MKRRKKPLITKRKKQRRPKRPGRKGCATGGSFTVTVHRRRNGRFCKG